MCGIAALVGPNSATVTIGGILERIAHRGLPGVARETEAFRPYGVELGTSRLPIVGPEPLRQPARSPNALLWVCFNGEVYNYASLARDLRRLGTSPVEPTSDSSVLAAALECWGMLSTLRRLDWEGAFMCVDTSRSMFFAARDHLGIKPLYWTALTGGGTAWASEVKGLLHLPAEGPIVPLAPGTFATIGLPARGAPRVTRWWKIEEGGATSLELPKHLDELDQLIARAVAVRIPSQPYALALSGGVDSALLLALAARSSVPLTAYTLFRPKSPDLQAAREACTRAGVPLVEVPAPAPLALRHRVRDTVWTVESWEWQVVNHAAPMAALTRAIAADGLRVVLSGEGADELFFGYQRPSSSPPPIDERVRRLNDLHKTNCRRLDRMGMHDHLEFRVPYLSRELLSFTLQLPRAAFVCERTNKWLLRKVAERHIGRDAAFRPKTSFARGAGYEYGDGAAATVFGELRTPTRQIPTEWARAIRYPVERVFMSEFLRLGFGRATYLQQASI